MGKIIYALHHGRRTNLPDPLYDLKGQQQIHLLRNVLHGWYLISEQFRSRETPMAKVDWIIHGTGRRFKELANKLLEVSPFKDALVTDHLLLGGEESVFEESGKEYVLTGDGDIVPREEYQLPVDLPDSKDVAWKLVESVENKMKDDTCAFLCTGRQFLTMLGLSKQDVSGGAIFLFKSVSSREVEIKIRY